jgi:hypoxanthine phosphoribosyltransferase
VSEPDYITPDKFKVVLDAETIQKRVAELGAEISKDLDGRQVILMGVLKGAFIFLSDLARNMNIPVKLDFVQLSSYGDSDTSSGKVEMKRPFEMDLTGHTIVVVEDIVDTGLTIKWFMDYLRSRGHEDVRCCALIDKAERRSIEVEIDYVGFDIPEGFLIGYGLDFAEDYRGIPGIYEYIG